jgi:argininosuccinate synthase
VDRIGQLTMRNLDIADSRARLEQYAAQGIISGETAALVGALDAGGAAAIVGAPVGDEASEAAEASLDRAAMEFGTD